MDKMREAFEAWFAGRYPNTDDRQAEFRMSSADELMFAAWQAATAAEREACAVICDKTAQSWANQELQWASSARDCADAIRSRE